MLADAMRRYGWPLAYALDEVPLATLRVLMRQPGPGGDPREIMGTAQMEIIEEMIEMGL